MNLKNLFRTNNDWTSLVLRLALGIMILPHGLQKTLGWFGGYGFSATLNAFTQQGIPWIFALAAILAESLGGIGLLTGFATRLSAFFVGMTMVVAAFKVHLANGFFMNWAGTNAGEGFEFHILAVGIALALVINGAGKFSLDQLVSRKLNAT